MKLNINKKNIIIIIIGIILLIGLIILICNSDNSNSEIDDTIENNESQEEFKVSGKLLNYLNKINDEYYIKYSGKFENSEGNLTDAIVEYTRSGKKYALKSNQLNINIVYDSSKLFNISHQYKLIITMGEENFPTNKYNFVADFGQKLLKQETEILNDKMYNVEEYEYAQNKIRYYFLDEDLKLLKYNDNIIKILRIEKKSYKELFDIPVGYKTLNS